MALLAMALMAPRLARAADPVFSAPIEVTADLPADGYKMSQNSGRQMGVDSAGTLHLTFFAGQFETNPETPSRIYHRSWTAAAGFSTATQVDDSRVPATDEPIGGRHPSLLVTADDTVWIAWHDHRHCTGGGLSNWINNLEIYADYMPSGGSFGASDIRLTQTAAGTFGDNSYAPRLVARPGGAVGLAWYDFHYSVTAADIFYHESATGFPAPAGMGAARVTDVGDRAPTTAFTMPDAAVDANGVIHLAWISGTTAQGDLYYGQLTTAGQTLDVAALRTGVTAFFNPPRLFAAADGSSVWLLWTDNPFGASDMHLLGRPAGGAWGGEITIARAGAQAEADGAIGPDGKIHLTWVEGGIRYARVNPAGGAIEYQALVAGPTFVNLSPHPSIHVAPSGAIYILWANGVTTGADAHEADLLLSHWTLPDDSGYRPGALRSSWVMY